MILSSRETLALAEFLDEVVRNDVGDNPRHNQRNELFLALSDLLTDPTGDVELVLREINKEGDEA